MTATATIEPQTAQQQRAQQTGHADIRQDPKPDTRHDGGNTLPPVEPPEAGGPGRPDKPQRPRWSQILFALVLLLVGFAINVMGFHLLGETFREA